MEPSYEADIDGWSPPCHRVRGAQPDRARRIKLMQFQAVSSSVDPWLETDLVSRVKRFGEQQAKDRNIRPTPRVQPTQVNRNVRDADVVQPSLQGYNLVQPQGQLPPAGGPTTDPGSAAAAAAIAGQWSAATGSLNPFALVGMDPNFLMGITNFGQFGFMQGPEASPIISSIGNINPTKDVIHLSSCTLYPPKPNAPLPTTRERPPGCRTVFVGGLPDLCTEDIIHDIFVRCGKICTIRMSKKNFCHIRFEEQSVVDNAIYLSGYRLKVGEGEETSSTGRLHVDYAHARDDQYEWECHQRAIQRELRHRERMEQERLRPPSPPPVVHYSDHEASLLAEKLKGEETFQKAAQILITWLERGELKKRNSGQFYSMIQSTNSNVRRLMNEKQQYEDELNAAKQLLRQRMQGILIQFNQIEKVFTAASHQKVWDHFTKAQRKNLDIWRKQAEETKNAQLEEVLKEREEDEMDLSEDDDDDNSSPAKKQKTGIQQNECLQDDNDLLRCQLEAYRNEVEVLRSESQQDKETLEQQVKMLQAALTGLQSQLVASSQQNSKDQQEMLQLKNQLQEYRDTTTSSSSSGVSSQLQAASQTTDSSLTSNTVTDEISSTSTPSKILVTEKEAALIGLVASFLHVHPFGASLEYIWSYLQKLEAGQAVQQPRDLESLLAKFPGLFKQELSGVGVSLERKWTFAGYV